MNFASQIKCAVDAKDYGNVARFINHSCNPNLFVQPTLSTHLDDSMPKICLFASRDTFPGEELTYDYGVEFVMDVLKGRCLCGAHNCVAMDASPDSADSADVSMGGALAPGLVGTDGEDMNISSNHKSISEMARAILAGQTETLAQLRLQFPEGTEHVDESPQGGEYHEKCTLGGDMDEFGNSIEDFSDIEML